MLPGESIRQIVTYEGAPDFAENTMQAAALCCCGVPIKTYKSPRERTGQVEWRFEYLPSAIPQVQATVAASIQIGDIIVNTATMNASQLMHVFREGELEKVDPAHPILDAMRALRNRERLLRWIMAGHAAQLVKHPRCDRWQYETAPVCSLPSGMAHTIHPTRELKQPCALGVFGVPMVRASGLLPDMTFEIAETGFAGDTTSPATCQLVRDFLSGDLDAREPDHPFFIAWSAVETMQKLKRHMQLEIANCWIEKPRSKYGRSAFLRADATSKARDTIFKHFRRGE